MGTLGICILVATILVTEAWIFLSGYDSWIHKVKTDEEKALRAAFIKNKTSQPHCGGAKYTITLEEH
ncbi:hypothetical protein [Candidatus Nitrotoga sp. M5]|uniref:hypothetical protein n=1 Tax=Candidatus Nitrotoga sp. M5 TaxID=2890409 RepID=UPI001EF5C3EE|nr:hypothetical protein [Candidatus Nitrotoga sp. M5]CAH1387057.1 hypothetical protein NTGM5_480053 [Candidatus Nitrotoga sp. M5]